MNEKLPEFLFAHYRPVDCLVQCGKRLSTCPQILVIQKAFSQSFTSYELLSVIKLLVFFLFFVEGDFFLQ